MRIFDATQSDGGPAMLATQARVEGFRGEARVHLGVAESAERAGDAPLAHGERREALRLMCLAAGLSGAQPDRSLLYLEAIGLAADLGDLDRAAELIEAARDERPSPRVAAWLEQVWREIEGPGRACGCRG